MEGTGYCMGCMHELDWDGRCHYCSFDEENYHTDQQLGLHTQLKHGEYMIGRQLGQGGFGITYIGIDTTLLQTVAIKEYFPFGAVKRKATNEIELYDEKYSKDFEKGLQAFLHEGRILARFSSLTAVVGVKNFFHENNTAYLVMDYVEGLSVREHVKRFGVLAPKQVLFMIRQVIADMQSIHRKHILHRDISADNLIITYDGKLKLIDFGATRQEFTKNQYTGTILCKQGYSAIEQYSTGRNQGPWTDIYGLCASIYFMLTGVVPDSAPDRIQNDCVKNLTEMDEIAMPRRQKQAIMKGLAVEVEHRYHTMAELYYVLYDEKLEDAPLYDRGNKENADLAKEKDHGQRVLLPNPRSISPTRMKRALDQLEEDRKGNKKKKRGLLAALVLACVILGVGIGQHLLRKDMHRKQQEQTIDKSVTTSPDRTNPAKEDQDTSAANANNTQEQSKKSAGTKSTPEQSKKSASTKSTPEQSKKSASTKSTPEQSKKSASTKSTPEQSKKSASTKSTPEQSKKSASTKSILEQSKKSASTKSTPTQSKKSKNTKKKVNKKANSLENVEKSTKDDSNVAGDLGE